MLVFQDITKQTSPRINLTSIHFRVKDSPSVNKFVDKNIFVNYSFHSVVKTLAQGEVFFVRVCKKM